MNTKLTEKNYHIWHPFTKMSDFYDEPLIFTEGHGFLLKDVNNKTYINALSGLWNTILGLGDQEVIEAVTAQLRRLSYASLFRMGHDPARRYAEKLVRVLPGNLNKVFFTSNGSEAVETMIKATRHYYRLQGKKEKLNIICLRRAYHGVSYGALSASGFPEDQEMYAPLLPGFIHIEPPYCYRCPYNKTVDDCRAECAREIENVIQKTGIDKIAAFLMEPILGFGGFIVPPDKFYAELKKILNKYELLLLLDEVTTGFGRTGKFFACEHWGLIPDMMAIGKAMSGGYIPLGAAVFSEEIHDTFLYAENNGRFAHGSTYSGHPAACAAGEKILDIYERENISAKARELEGELQTVFRNLQSVSHIGDIRGKGAMIALEFVTDPVSRNPLGVDDMRRLIRKIFQWGVLVHLSGNNILVIPPVTLPAGYVRKIYNAVGHSIMEVLKAPVELL